MPVKQRVKKQLAAGGISCHFVEGKEKKLLLIESDTSTLRGTACLQLVME